MHPATAYSGSPTQSARLAQSRHRQACDVADGGDDHKGRPEPFRSCKEVSGNGTRDRQDDCRRLLESLKSTPNRLWKMAASMGSRGLLFLVLFRILCVIM